LLHPKGTQPLWVQSVKVKRQYVCKQLTIERRDENSNGTP